MARGDFHEELGRGCLVLLLLVTALSFIATVLMIRACSL